MDGKPLVQNTSCHIQPSYAATKCRYTHESWKGFVWVWRCTFLILSPRVLIFSVFLRSDVMDNNLDIGVDALHCGGLFCFHQYYFAKFLFLLFFIHFLETLGPSSLLGALFLDHAAVSLIWFEK